MKKFTNMLLLLLILLMTGCNRQPIDPTAVSSETLKPPAVYIYQVDDDGKQSVIFGIDDSLQDTNIELLEFLDYYEDYEEQISRHPDYLIKTADKRPEAEILIKVWLVGEDVVFQDDAEFNDFFADSADRFYRSSTKTASDFLALLSGK